MSNDFWIDRWKENRIGFHSERVQPLLEKYWPVVAGDSLGRVLVPLCGKSHDLGWLAGRGHAVVGIELSEIAARSFASAHEIEFSVETRFPFTRMRCGPLEIDVGDFLEATPERVGRFDLVYDRAALIALPPETRRSYADILKQLLNDRGCILLITIEWNLDSDYGPPFSVEESEVRELFQGFDVKRLEERECLDEEPRFRDRGATWMKEVAYSLRAPGRRSPSS